MRGTKVPRSYLVKFAFVCRRAGLLNDGLRLLAPLIRKDRRRLVDSTASPREIVEYAALLQRSGATVEALRLLDQVDSTKLPLALLIRSFCHFMRWEYAESIPILHRYLDTPLDPYARHTAEVNLVAALVGAQQFDEALRTVSPCLASCRANGFHRLVGNCLELRSQVLIEAKRFDEADQNLREAEATLAQDSTRDRFAVFKWRQILTASQTQDTAPLDLLANEARRERAWETLREVDFFRVLLTQNGDLEHRLFFGTPYNAYHSRMLATRGTLPTTTQYHIGSSSSRNRFDILSCSGHGDTGIRPGGTAHRLLTTLAKDLYRPWTMGSLFQEVFPDAYYDVATSPQRVHQALTQLRAWFDQFEIPARIECFDQRYQLTVHGDFAFTIPRPGYSLAPNAFLLEKLNRDWHSDTWKTGSEISKCLALSGGSLWRFLQWATTTGRIEKFGAARSTAYRLNRNGTKTNEDPEQEIRRIS